jgi:alkanesulfonate monooxygenase
MNATHVGCQVEVFSISPRTTDEAKYWRDIREIVSLSDEFGFSGVLCFAGNDTMIEPWLVAHHICAASHRLRPLVATNPMYMHPFTVAKMISSFNLMYGRRVDVNLITGTSLVDQQMLNDVLDHDSRYDRLREYAQILKSLLSDARPVTFFGHYYALSNAVIRPRIRKSLLPTFYLAGQSAAAKKTADAVGATELILLRPDLEVICRPGGTALYLGIITRTTKEAAWQVAHDRYPPDQEGEKMLDFSMRYTESKWKAELKRELASKVPSRPGYWIEPFRSFRADCPYFVGSHESVAEMMATQVKAGVHTFVIDMWPEREEFNHVATALRLAKAQL